MVDIDIFWSYFHLTESGEPALRFLPAAELFSDRNLGSIETFRTGTDGHIDLVSGSDRTLRVTFLDEVHKTYHELLVFVMNL